MSKTHKHEVPDTEGATINWWAPFYDQFSSGRIVSRITSDTNDFGQLIVITS